LHDLKNLAPNAPESNAPESNAPESGASEATLPLAIGGRDLEISTSQLEEYLELLVDVWVDQQNVSRMLILPPDHTRLYSRAGDITAWLYRQLAGRVQVDVMPALGTHSAMTPEQCDLMFGDAVPYEQIIPHRWRDDLIRLGELSAEEIGELSNGLFHKPIPAEVNQRIIQGGYDLIVSVGQVVPHEVIGFANYTKNVCIGTGGKETIDRSHFMGAVCDMETIMGRIDTPVRQAIDGAFDRFVRPLANIQFLLTVIEETETGTTMRGIFAGNDDACYRQAATLSQQVNVTVVDRPFTRCVVYLDPREFHSTWLGNKSIYRTRMAMADGGQLLVVAPNVKTCGEDPAIDKLIRRFGYRGRQATLEAVQDHLEMENNLSAAAHVIHGSSEGRFTITYCPGPGMTRDEVEEIGYKYRPCDEVARAFDVERLTDGWHDGPDGEPFYFIRNPALGLWSTGDRFAN